MNGTISTDPPTQEIQEKPTEQDVEKGSGNRGQQNPKGTEESTEFDEVDGEKGAGKLYWRLSIPWIVVLAGIVSAVMLVTWAKLDLNTSQNLLTLIILIILVFPGFVTLLYFTFVHENCPNIFERVFGCIKFVCGCCCRCCCCCTSPLLKKFQIVENSNSSQPELIVNIDFAFLFVFATGYMVHYATYAFKHSYNDCDKNESITGILFNVMACCFAFLQLLYFLKARDPSFHTEYKFSLIFVLIPDTCIWFDALLSESADIFDQNVSPHNGSLSSNYPSILLLDEKEDNCTTNKDISKFIQYTDPLFDPMMIEFSLCSIHMMFAQIFSSHKESLSNSNVPRARTVETKCNIFSRNIICLTLCSFFIMAAFFMYTFYALLTDDDDDVNMEGTFHVKFRIYAGYQIAFKSVMIIILFSIIIITLLIHRDQKIRKFSISPPNTLELDEYFLLISSFGNIFYSTVNIIPLIHYWDRENTLSLFENFISIILALLQNIILILQSSKETANPKIKSFQSLWLILSFGNFGLWASDSIGESRIKSFTVLQYQHYTKTFWKIMTKIILPVTIFYRFHCAMEFLELWIVTKEGMNVSEDEKSCEETTGYIENMAGSSKKNNSSEEPVIVHS